MLPFPKSLLCSEVVEKNVYQESDHHLVVVFRALYRIKDVERLYKLCNMIDKPKKMDRF